jgi:hypothetical protein
MKTFGGVKPSTKQFLQPLKPTNVTWTNSNRQLLFTILKNDLYNPKKLNETTKALQHLTLLFFTIFNISHGK